MKKKKTIKSFLKFLKENWWKSSSTGSTDAGGIGPIGVDGSSISTSTSSSLKLK